ncbi:DUF2441 domain-containing protein [Cytobacillus firmus]|uniref:DUF2441 domain-containing protein n=1 Tax=Cytobacillus firmus TaxID=1399 RepID=UPI00300250C4
MEEVKDKVFYHIQTNASWRNTRKLEIGDSILTGVSANPFVKFLYEIHFVQKDSNTGQMYSAMSIAQELKNFLASGKKSEPFKSFYHYDCKDSILFLINAFEHSVKISREVIFEQVRLESFPNLPSREKCLWVIPSDDYDNYSTWAKALENGEVLKLSLNGKIHKTYDYHLKIEHDQNINTIRKNAYKYWSGEPANSPYEILFEGEAQVVNKTPLNEFVHPLE